MYTDLVIDWVSRRENPRAYWRLCWTNCKSSSETSTSSSGISDRSSSGRIIFSLFFLPIAVSLLTRLVSSGNFHWTQAKLLWFWSFWLGLDSAFAFYVCVFSFSLFFFFFQERKRERSDFPFLLLFRFFSLDPKCYFGL